MGVTATHGQHQLAWDAGEDSARDVGPTAGDNVIIWECVSSLVQVCAVHDPAVMIGRADLVVLARVHATGLHRACLQGASVERGRQSRCDGQLLGGSAGESAGGAGEDITARRFRERSTTVKGQDVVAHGAGNSAEGCLRVDLKWCRRVLGPHLIDVAVPVVGANAIVADGSRIWRECAHGTVGAIDNELIPAGTIGSVLCVESIDDGTKAILAHARDVQVVPISLGEVECDWYRDEVNVADICKHLLGVVRKLGEVPRDIDAGIRGIGHTWLDERGAIGTRVQQELNRLANGEPDAAASNLRDCADGGCARTTQGNGNVGGKRSAGRGGVGGVVRCFAVSGEEEELVAVVYSLASNEAINRLGPVGLVYKVDLEGSRGSRRSVRRRWCGVSGVVVATIGWDRTTGWTARRRSWLGGSRLGLRRLRLGLLGLVATAKTADNGLYAVQTAGHGAGEAEPKD